MLVDVGLVLAALSASASAQSTPTSTSKTSSSTSSSAVPTRTVSEGADGINFSPNQMNASVGDIIEFRFFPLNHSVARAAFGSQPCIPYEHTGRGRVGFWSGFRPISQPSPDPPIFQVAINDTEPMFFYCSAPAACLEGMVGVVNPNSTFTLKQQFDYTQNATQQYSPQEYFPPEVSMAVSRSTTATGAALATATETHTHTSTPLPVATKSASLPTGAIVGIALGAVALAVIVGAIIYMCGRQKTVKEIIRESTINRPPGTYEPATPAVSEAKYPNMTPNSMTDSRFGGQNGYMGNDHESYRAHSPPADERTGMMGHQYGQGGIVSPIPSPGYVSPKYYDSHEMESAHAQAGLRPYNPSEFSHQTGTNTHSSPNTHSNFNANPVGPQVHELAVPTPHPHTPQSRPFSFQSSDESGYLTKD